MGTASLPSCLQSVHCFINEDPSSTIDLLLSVVSVICPLWAQLEVIPKAVRAQQKMMRPF